MIEVNGVIPWSATERSAYPELPAREIHIGTRDARRSVEFYARVFGFRAIGDPADGAPVIMPVTARADLVIHTLKGRAFEAPPFIRAWGFVVANLDRVRQTVWDLGVVVARDSGAPDQIYRWANGRSLYVRAPDQNEIELVELWNGALRSWRENSHSDTRGRARYDERVRSASL